VSRIFHRLAGGFLLGILTILPVLPASAKTGRVVLTERRMNELRQVNSHVNDTIVEVSDMEQYGREDVWALPTSGRGDCEDFALLKRKLLVERGWPTSALSIAVGVTEQGETHAVLAVDTQQGTYVLDNRTSTILPPAATGHVFHARQAGRGWISASGARTREPTADLPVARRPALTLAGAN
jgi:predicted transglutaminase-like cysteine proteinase